MLSNLKREAESAASQTKAVKRAKIETPPLDAKSKTTTTQQQSRPFPNEKVDRIYLACPPNVQTGGPEAMHQLCDKINAIGKSLQVSAFMMYVEDRNGIACHVKNAKPLGAYSIYPNIQVGAEESCDGSKSLVIWPECWTNLIDSLPGSHQNAIWWLSVDNNNGKFQQWDRKDILHLHQSEYAKCHVVKNLKKETKDNGSFNSKQVLPMTEYIPVRHLPAEFKGIPRDLEILYNPLKGIHYTDEIRKRSEKRFRFTAIGGRKRLTPTQVTKLLHQAKVYCDFGPHPGMDRLPREAAIANCIVITNKDGAAFHDEDVPTPARYKMGDFDVERIHKLLVESIDGYEEKKKDFDSYRKWIASQEYRMDSCVKVLINSVVTERSE